MNAQRALTLVAIAAGLVAGVVYFISAHRVPAVVAAADLAPGRAITAADVEVRAFPVDTLPGGVVADAAVAVGKYVRTPVSKGQLILASSLAASPGAFDSGIALPTGHRAVAIPVSYTHLTLPTKA